MGQGGLQGDGVGKPGQEWGQHHWQPCTPYSIPPSGPNLWTQVHSDWCQLEPRLARSVPGRGGGKQSNVTAPPALPLYPCESTSHTSPLGMNWGWGAKSRVFLPCCCTRPCPPPPMAPSLWLWHQFFSSQKRRSVMKAGSYPEKRG